MLTYNLEVIFIHLGPMKLKTIYICSKCNEETGKWSGQCNNCHAWNTLMEDVINIGKANKKLSTTARRLQAQTPVNLGETKVEKVKISSGIAEFDRVVGDGILPGSLTLLSGEPGIGKSTLTLQIAHNFAKDRKTLLVSGEESVEQIAGRAQRLKLSAKNLSAVNEFSLEMILETIKKEKPEFVIIDSIQVISSEEVESSSGSISQVRYCTERIMELAKSHNIAIVLIGHVTKQGNLAGPRVLEHLVDTVLHLEGDRFQQFRILRAVKNRFGSCAEVGIFEMKESGLEEVQNPSQQFLEGRKENAIGSVITVALEGTRPFLVEVQALTSISHFGYPKRTANGFDLNRLQILIAILEKHCKLNLQNQDIFINIVGGIKLVEPAADLAILIAIASSLLKKTIKNQAIVFGEAGLSGELRRVSHQEKREKESQKMGFEKVISPEQFKEITEAIRNGLTSA